MITYVNPVGSMELLSQLEVDSLQQAAAGEIYQLYRNCSLAVLNSGSKTDSSKEILEKFQNFSVNIISRERGNPHSWMERSFVVYRNICFPYYATSFMSANWKLKLA